MSTREDIKLYPVYFYDEELQEVYEIDTQGYWNKFERDIHHYIRTQAIRNNPEKYTKEFLKDNQRLYLLPKNMHAELHAKHSKFYEKYGINIKDLLYDYEGKLENDI